MITRYLALLLVFGSFSRVWTQTDDTSAVESSVTEDSWEESLLQTFSDFDASALAEELAALRENPIDLNRASAADLERIPGFTTELAQEIVARRKREVFRSERELLLLKNMTRSLFVSARDYLTVGDPSRAKPVDVLIRQRTKRALDLSEDHRSGGFDGDPFQTYERVNMTYRPDFRGYATDIRAGVVLEKDPGEARLDDHRSVFVEVQNAPGVREAVLGNYQLTFGQGLVLWGASGIGKTSEATSAIRRSGRGLRPFNYATENQSHFGIGVTPETGTVRWLSNVEVTGFYSYNYRDASFNPDGTVNGILTDGLHRDSLEASRRRYLLETMGGANVDVSLPMGKIGVTFYAQQFSRYFVINDSIRNRFDFRGGRHAVGGLHYDLKAEHWRLFGEFAVDRRGQGAFLGGVSKEERKADLVMVFRSYSRDFQNLHAFAFGEQNGKTQNELGLYTGIKWKPVRGRAIQAYYDLYRFPWRTFDVPQPVTGDDFMAQWSEDINRRNNLTLLFKNERKDEAVGITDEYGREITVVEPGTARRLRGQWTFAPVKALRLRSRIEHSWVFVSGRGGRKSGMLLHEDFRYEPWVRLTIQGRVTFFDADPSVAMYEYENDVEGVFSNTVLTGKGRRWYLLAKFNVNRHFKIAVKYWELTKDGVTEIGSGGSAVRGHRIRQATMSFDAVF